MEDSNGLKTEVRLHSREIEKLREKAHKNSNALQHHEDRLERLEDAAKERKEDRQFGLGLWVAIGSSVLASATAIVLTLVK